MKKRDGFIAVANVGNRIRYTYLSVSDTPAFPSSIKRPN